MASVDRKAAFCERYLTTPLGAPYKLTEERIWVRDELMAPVDGFRLWPREEKRLCSDCEDDVGRILSEWTWDTPEEDHRPACAGLKLVPIHMTVLCLPRREGKTYNSAADCIATSALDSRQAITYMASAGSQATELFEENFERPITNHPRLDKITRIVNNKITFLKTKSVIEHIETSHRSATGRGRTRVVIEEARDVTSRTFLALLPAIEGKGMRCPNGHKTELSGGGEYCNRTGCGARMVPWFGRCLIISSAGVVSGDDRKDWYSQLVEHIEANPHPSVHLYRTDQSTNPDVASTAIEMIQDVFGALPATKQLVEVEVGNVFAREGDDYLTSAEIKRTVDKTLVNEMGSTALAVGHLDTSISKELTSLVIVRDDPKPGREPWDRLVVSRIDVHDPKKQRGGVISEEAVLALLDEIMPLYQALKRLHVDTRVMPWAERLVAYCRSNRPWGKKIHRWQGQRADRQSAYAMLEYRIGSGTIVLPNHQTLIAELLAARRVQQIDGQTEIREQSRKVRHLDIADALAHCCLHAHGEKLKSKPGLEAVERSEIKAALSKIYGPSPTAGLNERNIQ